MKNYLYISFNCTLLILYSFYQDLKLVNSHTSIYGFWIA